MSAVFHLLKQQTDSYKLLAWVLQHSHGTVTLCEH